VYDAPYGALQGAARAILTLRFLDTIAAQRFLEDDEEEPADGAVTETDVTKDAVKK
jgi:hypothetical protein